MILYEPYLKKRIDKSKPQQNIVLGDPYDLFSNFENRVSFHFFTVDNQIKPFAWKTLISDSDINITSLKKEILAYVNIKDLISDYSYLNKFGIELQYVVFNDNRNWTIENGSIYLVSFDITSDESIEFSFREFDKVSFQKFLREIQGQDMIMNKPLIYSTTELEGYFADMCQRNLNPVGKAIFPGDVDLVIYNNNKTLSIIEFKKHTKYGEGRIGDQSFLKYWFKDKKKYSGIALLTKKLNRDFFYNVIYSTKDNELNKIKIEKISSDLKLLTQKLFTCNNREEAILLVQKYIVGDINEE